MGKKEYEQFFKGVAIKVEERVSTDKVLMQNMRNALKEFGAQEAKSCQYMKRLYDKAKKEGKNFKVASGMQIPDKYKSPMRAMLSKHEYIKDGYGQKCIGAYLPNLDNNPKERQRRNYVALAIIHDNMLPEAERVNNDILPSELAGRIWELFSPYQVFDNDDQPWYGDKKPFLEVAMMSIKADVAEKPAEPDKVKGGTQAYPGPRRQVPTSDADRQRAYREGYTVGDYKYAPDLPKGETATKQKTTLAKELKAEIESKEKTKLRIIGWIVEGIMVLALLFICLYFLGTVTGILVLAALLTILHCLGWLGPVKALISKILGSK